ncbi:MAG TPA: hypothetical protein VF651_06390 [Gammaproteobacteria bacterium]
MKKSVFIVLMVLVTIFGSACAAAGGTQSTAYVKGQVYLFHWEEITNRIRPLSEVRTERTEYVEISNVEYLKAFVGWLRLDALTEVEEPVEHNALFVIDLTKADGGVDTYYSDGCNLYSADSKYSRPIDASFRKQFDFYGDDMVFKTSGKSYKLCGN